MTFSGVAEVSEWYDSDRRFHIQVDVKIGCGALFSAIGHSSEIEWRPGHER